MNPRLTIWFAITFSTVIYLVLAVYLSAGERTEMHELARTQYVPIFYGLALVLFVVGSLVVKKLVKGPAQTQMIVALGVFEACAILGLMCAILTKDWRYYLGPWALALIGFMREKPMGATGEPPEPM